MDGYISALRKNVLGHQEMKQRKSNKDVNGPEHDNFVIYCSR